MALRHCLIIFLFFFSSLVAFPGNSYHYLTDLSGIFPSHKISPCLMDNVVDFERRKPTKNLGATSGGNFRERPLVAEESDPDEEGIVVLPSTAVVNNDYFVSGRTVEISGRVNGDVYVYGGQVFIDGTINGDVLAAGGSIEVSGKVSNDVRLIAGQATISGEIGRNLTCLTATVELGPSAVIGGNIVVVSGNTDLESRVAQNVHLYSSSVRISNNVAGNVTAYVGHLRITSKANIGGILEYWSNKNALIAPEAKIAGGVTHHPSFFYKFFQGKFIKGLKLGSKLAALMMNFLYSFVIGLILIRYFPFRITRTIETLNAKPAQSLVAGLVLIFLLPIVMLALIVTILGVPFALTLLSLTVVGFYTAKILTILWLATHIFRKFEFKKHRRLYFAFSLALYLALTLIPYVGWLVTLGALFFGVGGGILGKIEKAPKKRLFQKG